SVGGNVCYSIQDPVGEKSRFSVGASMVLENRKLDVSEITVRDQDDFYDQLLASATAQTVINLRVGVLLYTPDYYVCLSYFPVLYTVLEASELAMTEPFYRGSVQVGVSLPLSADVTLKPGVLALLRMDNDIAIDYGVKAFFR